MANVLQRRAWDFLRSFNVCAAGFYCFAAYELGSGPGRIISVSACAASVLLAANAHRMCKRLSRHVDGRQAGRAMTDDIQCKDGVHVARTMVITAGVPSEGTCDCGKVRVEYDGCEMRFRAPPLTSGTDAEP